LRDWLLSIAIVLGTVVIVSTVARLIPFERGEHLNSPEAEP
jgi:hypothetical protein